VSSPAYRPANWGQQTQLYSMTCTLPATNPAGANNASPGAGGTPAPATQQPTTYYFDATLRVEHSQEAVFTEHPVQIGPAVVDHVYLRPARVVLEVAMSDAMDSYQSGQYSSGSSKSVSAYQTFKDIQAARVPITLRTRYDTYQNMGIEDVRGTEDARTKTGFRGALYFREIISATVSTTTVSQRPNQTDSTNEGPKSTETLDPTTQNLLNQVIAAPQP